MKVLRLVIPLALAVCACLPLSINADEGSKTPPSPPHKEGEEGAPRRQPRLPGLTEEENKKVLEAIKKAEKDPTVIKAKEELHKSLEEYKKLDPNEARPKIQEARKKYMDVARAAAIKADPSVEALFKKSDAARSKGLERKPATPPEKNPAKE